MKNVLRNSRISRLILLFSLAAAIVIFGSGFTVEKSVLLMIEDYDSIDITEYKTGAGTVGEFFRQNNITFDSEYDTVSCRINNDTEDSEADYETIICEMDDRIKDGMEIIISKQFHVTVTADGETKEITIDSELLPMTVKEILKSEGYTLGSLDRTSIRRSEIPENGASIVIKRVEKKTKTVDEYFGYNVKTIYTNKVTIGDKQVIQDGKKGRRTATYEVTYVDGKEEGRKLLSEEVTREAVDKIYGLGTKIDISKPAKIKRYKKKMTVSATCYYSKKKRPLSASGKVCKFGTIAVDKKLIPLGTKVYVEGYGYAEAIDTGGAIKGHIIDLFMTTRKQCFLWGRRTTTLYILYD